MARDLLEPSLSSLGTSDSHFWCKIYSPSVNLVVVFFFFFCGINFEGDCCRVYLQHAIRVAINVSIIFGFNSTISSQRRKIQAPAFLATLIAYFAFSIFSSSLNAMKFDRKMCTCATGVYEFIVH